MLYRIWAKAIFPEGIAPGEGKEFTNILTTARNGVDKPLLRGTSIAGALRSKFSHLCQQDETVDNKLVDEVFGESLQSNQDSANESKIKIPDMIINSAHTSDSDISTHNMINRHTGTPVKGGLFSLEKYLANCYGTFVLYINSPNSSAVEDDAFLKILERLLADDLLLGGNKNRGLGRMKLERPQIATFDPNDSTDFALWINTRYQDNKNSIQPCSKDRLLVLDKSDNNLSLNLKLRIPRGEDLVVGYGTTMDNLQSSPQDVVKADGNPYWVIPGSTFRGVFKSWMTRLAALDGCHIYDSATDNPQKLKGDDLGWGVEIKKEDRKKFQENPEKLDDPIMDLFGSLYKRGRIHFGNAYSTKKADKRDKQLRCHVAVDRFSGGANDGMLFQNEVLVSGVEFLLNIIIEDYKEQELEWLLKTIRAVNMGIISFGSSNASGLLEVENFGEVEKQILEAANG